jgi:hypothetical protein
MRHVGRADVPVFPSPHTPLATAPALSPAEWNGVLLQQDGLAHLREQFGKLPFSAHAIAALLLFEQPFGFTQQDVQDEEEVSAYCAAMATQHRDAGDRATAAKFELLGGRHMERALKIAALLPPPGTSPAA